MINYPVSVTDLARALPHRPPMTWVDTVIEAAADGGICTVVLKEDGLYQNGGEGVLEFAPIEWIAQCFGYARACFALAQAGEDAAPPGVQRAFLVGVSDFHAIAKLPSRGQLLVETRLVREMSPLALVAGSVKSAAGELLATAKLKLYFE